MDEMARRQSAGPLAEQVRSSSGLHPDDELPTHPAIQHWLEWYAAAATERERDGVVGLMLRDLNARLLRAELAAQKAAVGRTEADRSPG
jgi:hypothetical protein